MGVITGSMLVNGNPRDASFQRQTGYVQQQDLHLHTSTVREALTFSALLRQPSNYSKEEKIAYVDTVIELLDMQPYVDAIIGVPGEGLNVEQRKRLTIGVELAARPKLLLFLDEPTSGLDSQTSWSICNLMEKLTNSGQAILCTIHQPSAILFQRFDRLLLLAKGGRTVYFGPIGKSSQTLLDYFVRNGGAPCPPEGNPAEHMLHVIGAAPGSGSDIDWPVVWRNSPEYRGVQDELARLSSNTPSEASQGPAHISEFAAPLGLQFKEVCRRVFQQYYRSPTYVLSKGFLSAGGVRYYCSALPFLEFTLTFIYRPCSLACLSSTLATPRVVFRTSSLEYSSFLPSSVSLLTKFSPSLSLSVPCMRLVSALRRAIHGWPSSVQTCLSKPSGTR